MNQFKFDGTGNVDSVFPGSRFDSDFAAAIHLIGELRAVKPDIFINLTTGTWPSPFWLIYADSIWRGGEDDDTVGVGTIRERWITYRDAQTYHGIVQNGPLFPLSSLMLHGMIYAKYRKQLDSDPGNDFRNEVRSYFGTGTQLQEMYITPSLLTDTQLGRPRRGGKVVACQRRGVERYALDWWRSCVARGVWMGFLDAGKRRPRAAKSER